MSEVYKAINAVSFEIAQIGIAKDSQNTFHKYSFRGIDDVLNTISPLLARNKLVIIPRVLNRHCVERVSKNDGVTFYVNVDVEFDFISSVDGSIHTARMSGEAMDSSDKATNKAISAAYKYLAFTTFCIPTEAADDADLYSPEVLAEKTQSLTEKYKYEAKAAAEKGINALTAWLKSVDKETQYLAVPIATKFKLDAIKADEEIAAKSLRDDAAFLAGNMTTQAAE